MEQIESTVLSMYEDFAIAPSPETNNGIGTPQQFGTLYGSSPAMQGLYEMLKRVAPTDATVLIVGESGSGKELVATTIHQISTRASQPFIAINCSTIPANLIEAELFGYEKGSFTGAARQHKGHFERASGGTLFLDEITEMPLELQARLLRALESRKFRRVGGDSEIESHARIVAATNYSPAAAVAVKKLREDLLYRLSVFPVSVPALHERDNDIVELAELFLSELNNETGFQKYLPDGAKESLKAHPWPGNVRELRNVIQRAYILADDALDFTDLLVHQHAYGFRGMDKSLPIRVGMSLNEAERQIIFATLNEFGGNKRRAAKVLGISLKTLYNRLTEYQNNIESLSFGSESASANQPSNEGTLPLYSKGLISSLSERRFG